MLEVAREQLERVRSDPTAWQTFAFVPSPDNRDIDVHEVARHGLILALQYDLRPSDHALVRAIVHEATRAHEGVGGLSESLRLARWLLAQFRDASDVLLAWRAKNASGDLHTGADGDVVAAGVEPTLAWLATTDSNEAGAAREYIERAAENEGADFESRARVWREEAYPRREEDENLLTRVERAAEFGVYAEGAALLDAWEQTRDYAALATIARLRGVFGQADEAMAAWERRIALAQEDHDTWRETSARTEAASAARDLGQFARAWFFLVEGEAALLRVPEWQKYGLGRSFVAETLRLVPLAEPPIRQEAWALARRLRSRGCWLRSSAN